MTKICLNSPVEDQGRMLPQGLIGRQVMRTGFHTWLIEFKYPDFAYPCRTKRVYAELNAKSFTTFDEAPYQAQ